MIRQPPRSTLFPYTTPLPIYKVGQAWIGERPKAEEVLAKVSEITGRTSSAFGLSDRKSTRLNSSHSQISYAVFCLKKKKNKIKLKNKCNYHFINIMMRSSM